MGKKIVDDEWISALAAQMASREPVTKGTKQERIEKRNRKKRQREERLGPRFNAKFLIEQSRIKNRNDCDPHRKEGRVRRKETQVLFTKFSNELRCILERLYPNDSELGVHNDDEHLRVKKFTSIRAYHDPQSLLKGKAIKGQQLTSDDIQPRTRDYGGLGLARPSLLLSLRDPSFIPKLEEEFAEHIPGFFGKQRTQAMKKQLDGDMLWRRLQKGKESSFKANQQGTEDPSEVVHPKKRKGRKVVGMQPDERVEAILKAGLL